MLTRPNSPVERERSPRPGVTDDARRGGRAGTLLVAHSDGRGGGIERYVATVEAALRGGGESCVRLNLHDRTSDGLPDERRLAGALRQRWTTHHRLSRDISQQLAVTVTGRLVLAYIHLLPAALMATRAHPAMGITVVMYGNEIWAPGLPRRAVRRLLRHPRVRPVAISGFSAGALYPLVPAGVLPPGLSAEWFDALVAAGGGLRSNHSTTQLMTSFRLESWREKGLPEIVEAIRRTRRSDLRLVVCGSGPVPAELRRLVDATPFSTLRHNLSDKELAAQFAAADLFVLATRLQRRPVRSGEGFGLVLAEAQVAGTPVVAPAHGGSSDAFRPGITGVAPVDQSSAALADAIGRLVGDPDRLAQMGRSAALWAREEFDPVRYAAHAREMLL
jgi:phosphatidyl-myo-inositol dimannoside synthase